MHVSRILPAIGLVGMIAATPSFAQSEDVAEEALTAFLQAAQDHDAAALDALLAPEFQVMRSVGGGTNKADYLAGVPDFGPFSFSDMVVTTHGDIMVVRYTFTVVETTDGQAVSHQSPRLTVFRREGEIWQVVAHANFAEAE